MLIVGGIVGGLIGGILHAIATVGFGVDQIISGVAINLLAPGIAKYLSGIYFTTNKALSDGGGPTQSPKVPAFDTLTWHRADDWFTKVQHHHWFFVSDVAGLLDGLVTSLNVFTIIALALIPLTWFVLWRTAFGLRLRSCGENPTAAETLGVRVYTTKAIAVVISGVLAGLAGAFLVDYSGVYHDGQTGGRGFIGLAAMIFGNWRPGGLLAGSSLFGYTDGLQQQSSTATVHALLLLVAIVLVLVGFYQLYKRNAASGVVSLVTGGLVLLWYVTTDSIPAEFATYSPQIITLFVLALASQRLRPPAFDGIPWRRGQGA
jgi:simple sugar transport system permease protein